MKTICTMINLAFFTKKVIIFFEFMSTLVVDISIKEVEIMEIQFNTQSNMGYSTMINHHSLSNDMDMHVEFENTSSLKKEAPPKVMMDLQDVQNFLYMIIGSEIRVKSTNTAIGAGFNTAA